MVEGNSATGQPFARDMAGLDEKLNYFLRFDKEKKLVPKAVLRHVLGLVVHVKRMVCTEQKKTKNERWLSFQKCSITYLFEKMHGGMGRRSISKLKSFYF